MILLKSPKNGQRINLHTKKQTAFIRSERAAVQIEDFDFLDLKKSNDEDLSFPESVRFEWEADSDAVIEISESVDFDDVLLGGGNGYFEIDNLKCGVRYFWRVRRNHEVSEVFFFDTEDVCPRFIKIDGTTNVRDCGGWKTDSGKKIKQGFLYRGSELNSHVTATEDGINTMKNVLRIKSILDLRGSTEKVRDVYNENYINIPVQPYKDWLTDKETAKKVFDFLTAEENYPIYYHCWGGADRTGTMAFMLGALLGQSYADLIDDYEITSLSIWGIRTRNSENLCKKFLDEFDRTEGETTREKAENYFLSCGVSKEQIEKFRAIMLE